MVERALGDVNATILYSDINVVQHSLVPCLTLSFNVSTRVRAANGSNLTITNPRMKVYVRREGNFPNIFIGEANTETLIHSWTLYDTRTLDFVLRLDHHLLSQIERLRGNAKLSLLLRTRLVYTSDNDARPREVEFDLDILEIPKSKWVEEILPQLGFKNVALIELPQLEFPLLQAAIDNLNQAWKKYSMGETNDVFVRCRTVLEELGTYLRKNGFETKFKDANGNDKPIPDWDKFLNHKNKGDILGIINQKINGFVAPGAHAGSVVDIHEAYFALLQTYSMAYYVIEHARQQSQA